MKAICSWLLFGNLAFLTVNPGSAQTPPSLSLQLFAGVNVTGAVGSVYVVQSTSNLTQSNSWTSLGFVQLAAANYLFVDTTSPTYTGSHLYEIVFSAFSEKSAG